ncbi:MAG: gamma carbonic anhydrase family protein, partial [Clostridia bacterium]|nr:gamma carbonic anhydrase family protein [Clostridia bacterium]
GHGAILHGCTIEDEALIGMGAIILNGAVIGAGSIVGAGALVTAGTVLPENSLAVGSPAKVIRQVTPEQRAATVQNALQYVKEAEEYKKEA